MAKTFDYPYVEKAKTELDVLIEIAEYLKEQSSREKQTFGDSFEKSYDAKNNDILTRLTILEEKVKMLENGWVGLNCGGYHD